VHSKKPETVGEPEKPANTNITPTPNKKAVTDSMGNTP
jgi:hypothetical protein